MSCCCCAKEEEDAFQSKQSSSALGQPSVPPQVQTMADRATGQQLIGSDSDRKAVAWLRDRTRTNHHSTSSSLGSATAWELQTPSIQEQLDPYETDHQSQLNSKPHFPLQHQEQHQVHHDLQLKEYNDEKQQPVLSPRLMASQHEHKIPRHLKKPLQQPQHLQAQSQQRTANRNALQQRGDSLDYTYNNATENIPTANSLHDGVVERTDATRSQGDADDGWDLVIVNSTTNDIGVNSSRVRYAVQAPQTTISPLPSCSMDEDDSEQPSEIDYATSFSLSEPLSEIPTDVDSQTRDRYMLACRLLKCAMLDKERKMSQEEHQYLQNLLMLYDQSNAKAIDACNTAMAYESVAQALQTDNLFWESLAPKPKSTDMESSTFSSQMKGEERNQHHSDKPESYDPQNEKRHDHDADCEKALMKLVEGHVREQQRPTRQPEQNYAKERLLSCNSSNQVIRSISNQSQSTTPSNFKRLLCQPLAEEGKKSIGEPSELLEQAERRVDSPKKFYDVSSPCRSMAQEAYSLQQQHTPVTAVESESHDDWDSQSNSSDNWNAPFRILGLPNKQDWPLQHRVLKPSIMEALRGFFPIAVSEANFWLKFSRLRDGSSLPSMLSKVMGSSHTIISIETEKGDVFGAFCSSTWRIRPDWYGNGECFLWCAKRSGSEHQKYHSPGKQYRQHRSNEIKVYPFTGHDYSVQYCTERTLAVGGGNWDDVDMPCIYDGEPTGIGLLIDGDLEGGETNSCSTFANPRLCGRDSHSNEFAIKNLEVWTLTPCSNVVEAQTLEESKLFIENNLVR